jgi:hypothetical protein
MNVGIKKFMQNLLSIFMGYRQCGYTTLINKIAKENDVYVIIHNNQMKEIFDEDVQDKLISMNNLTILEDAPKKPILLDNATLHLLLRESLLKMGEQEEKIEGWEYTIKSIEEIIRAGKIKLS